MDFLGHEYLGTSIGYFFRLIDSVNKIEVAADWLALKYMWVQLGYALRWAAPT